MPDDRFDDSQRPRDARRAGGSDGERLADGLSAALASVGAENADDLVRPHVAKPHPDRARQFMPFAALKGYYDLVRDRERVVEPRREQTEDDVARISARLAALRKGDAVRAVHYVEREGSYIETRGGVSRIDPTFQTIVVGSTAISFSDLADIAPTP